MADVATMVADLQDVDLAPDELTTLVTALTEQGLTESVRRQIRSALMKVANKSYESLDRHEQALDVARDRDAKIEAAGKKAEQAMNRVEMQTKAQLETIGRKVGEDVEAAKSGATLLLHTEDVTPNEPAAPMTPKESAAVAMASARAPKTIESPIIRSTPIAPMPTNEPIPATMAPLPPTPITPQSPATPPAMTEPSAA